MYIDAIPSSNTDIVASTEQAERFAITDESSANWLLSKLGMIETERARVKAQAAQRDAELVSDYNRLMHLFGDQLKNFAMEEAERRRRRSVTLLQGTLAFRTVPSKLIVEDVDTAITTARAVAPETITIEEVTKFDKDAFLKRAAAIREETGEILPGVKQTESTDSFSVKFAGSKDDKAEQKHE